MKNLNAIIGAIANLEAKQDNGTITMTEETILCRLIESAESMITNL